MKSILMVGLFVVVSLAGCASESGGDGGSGENVDPDSFELKRGKGAIAGLLVDDRFRPIHLTDDPTSQFQDKGFILLQETGKEVKTTENGEFTFVDLDPGTYTLRVSAGSHEGSPQSVQVVEGEFAEATIIARRVSSATNVIITEEYSAFSPCFINFVALSYTADCTGDESGDSFRPGFTGRNVSDLGKVSWIVGEALFNQEPQGGAAFDVVIRREIGHDYSAAMITEGRYAKLHIQNGSLSPDTPPAGNGFVPWHVHNGTFEMLMFGRGYMAEEIRTTYEPVYEFLNDGTVPCQDIPELGICVNEIPMRRGAGGTLGNEATFLISIFIGEPEVDPLQYCALCEPDA